MKILTLKVKSFPARMNLSEESFKITVDADMKREFANASQKAKRRKQIRSLSTFHCESTKKPESIKSLTGLK